MSAGPPRKSSSNQNHGANYSIEVRDPLSDLVATCDEAMGIVMGGLIECRGGGAMRAASPQC